MNYNLITEELIVGSQPQKAEDIDHLKNEQNVAYILNLQQDNDIAYWGIDLESIVKRCQQDSDITWPECCLLLVFLGPLYFT